MVLSSAFLMEITQNYRAVGCILALEWARNTASLQSAFVRRTVAGCALLLQSVRSLT